MWLERVNIAVCLPTEQSIISDTFSSDPKTNRDILESNVRWPFVYHISNSTPSNSCSNAIEATYFQLLTVHSTSTPYKSKTRYDKTPELLFLLREGPKVPRINSPNNENYRRTRENASLSHECKVKGQRNVLGDFHDVIPSANRVHTRQLCNKLQIIRSNSEPR